MQAIINFFTSISSGITSLLKFAMDLIQDLCEMAVMLATAAAQLPSFLSFLPPPVVTLLGTFLTAAILYKVLGREG